MKSDPQKLEVLRYIEGLKNPSSKLSPCTHTDKIKEILNDKQEECTCPGVNNLHDRDCPQYPFKPRPKKPKCTCSDDWEDYRDPECPIHGEPKLPSARISELLKKYPSDAHAYKIEAILDYLDMEHERTN